MSQKVNKISYDLVVDQAHLHFSKWIGAENQANFLRFSSGSSALEFQQMDWRRKSTKLLNDLVTDQAHLNFSKRIGAEN